MTAWIVLGSFVVLVGVLAALGARHTRGRACCAPADASSDLRMRDAFRDPPSHHSAN